MGKIICSICGTEKGNSERCKNCGSYFFKDVSDIPEEDFGLLDPLEDLESIDIDFENLNLEDFEDDSLFEGNSIIRKDSPNYKNNNKNNNDDKNK